MERRSWTTHKTTTTEMISPGQASPLLSACRRGTLDRGDGPNRSHLPLTSAAHPAHLDRTTMLLCETLA